MFDSICEAIRREIDKLDEKYESGVPINDTDLRNVDTMAHALKNLATYVAMKEGASRDRRRYRDYYDSDYRRY